MDIRNFFGPVKAKGKKTTTKTKSTRTAASSRSPTKDTSSPPKKSRISLSDDEEEDLQVKPVGRKSKITSSSPVSKPTSSSPKKRKSGGDRTKGDADNKAKRIEVSAEDFFGSVPSTKRSPTASKRPASTGDSDSKSKKKSRAKVIIESSSEGEDDKPAPLSSKTITTKSPAAKKTNALVILEDNDDAGPVQTKKPAVVSVDSKPIKSKRRRSSADDEDEFRDDETKAVQAEELRKRPTSQKKSSPKVTSSATSQQSKQAPSESKQKVRRTSKSKKKPETKTEAPIKPSLELPSFDVDEAAPECLTGNTFVFSGVLEDITREEASEFVKILGGRVTTAVSSRTTYLVVGERLEDGREYTEGKKYKAALDNEKIVIVKGKKALFGLCKLYSDKKRGSGVVDGSLIAKTASSVGHSEPKEASSSEGSVKKISITTTTKSAPVANPYAKKKVSNPYAKSKSTSLLSSSSNPYASKAAPKATPMPSKVDSTALWADLHAPASTQDILGNQQAVRQLQQWLAGWERKFNPKFNPKARDKTFSNPKGPWKAALLSGPPGIGKTTTATLVAKEAGRDLLEFNASDARGKKALTETIGDITGSRVFDFGDPNSKKKSGGETLRCIIMDEVDGMGAGDRSGISELISMIKRSLVPIICICNDRQSQKIKSLLPYCMDLRYRRPTKQAIARRAVRIGNLHGMTIEQNAAEAIADSCGNDIRQVLNCLQMWSSKKGKDGKSGTMTYKEVKERESSMNKDEILRVSMFDACKLIVEGPRGMEGADAAAQRKSFFKRNDAFFVDYSLMGLNVHQNYLKVMQGAYATAKRSGKDEELVDFLSEMHQATDAMSDYALCDQAIRGIDQNWSLLPTCAMLTVKTGYHAGGGNGGFLPGFPEFAGWLGKNSTRTKKVRLLNELGHHMNYRISGGTVELRLAYLPLLRERFNTYLSDESGARTEEMIELMDTYGLDRDDVFENLDEFKMDSKKTPFNNILDSKQKAAFTRLYNSGNHTSQALVAEQGVGGRSNRKRKARVAESKELDAIDDDADQDEEEDEEEEDELTEEKLRAIFKSKGKRKSGGGKKVKKAGATKAKSAKSKHASAMGSYFGTSNKAKK